MQWKSMCVVPLTAVDDRTDVVLALCPRTGEVKKAGRGTRKRWWKQQQQTWPRKRGWESAQFQKNCERCGPRVSQ